jgi:hypothetical protein
MHPNSFAWDSVTRGAGVDSSLTRCRWCPAGGAGPPHPPWAPPSRRPWVPRPRERPGHLRWKGAVRPRRLGRALQSEGTIAECGARGGGRRGVEHAGGTAGHRGEHTKCGNNRAGATYVDSHATIFDGGTAGGRGLGAEARAARGAAPVGSPSRLAASAPRIGGSRESWETPR